MAAQHPCSHWGQLQITESARKTRLAQYLTANKRCVGSDNCEEDHSSYCWSIHSESDGIR